MRRDFSIAPEYCCDGGAAMGSGLGPLRVFEEKVAVGGSCRSGGKLMSGTILVSGRRSIRLEMSGAGSRGFL